MEDYLRAVILGLVQALTEFLPISSSAHLVVAGHVLGDRANSLTFDVGLHVGTLVAVLAYFWRDWLLMFSSGVCDITVHRWRVRRWLPPSRLGLWIILGTLPAVVVGRSFDAAIEEHLRELWLVGVMLIAFGLLLHAADRLEGRRRTLDDIRPWHALLIGVAQTIALVPGVSRSGVTITAARALGFDRAIAARFSFLLSAPIVFGAATLKLSEAASGAEDVSWGPMLVGALVSAVAGVAVIHWLIRYLQAHGMRPFVWYRIGLGAVILIIAAASR